ncbi:MarR family transcriptional regulator [Spongiibacter sp. KMU-166]|uniref:MarR family transcriptional regulator n=1 Tax=Spongiibacter thalassae TaxID=2721624 RepID=A0ABX1GAG5_9GAMM|nr:MarR family transcriptional regulator [Spongiibacter thalassae]NKI15945.1 MarR family transcriptional regulator [Spongiibacter thalassae]
MTVDIDSELMDEIKPELVEALRADLMGGLLRAFNWMDQCLQKNIAARGWEALSRTESQIMVYVAQGTRSPVEIARALGLSPQAINQASKPLIKRGLIRLEPDPLDGRRKLIFPAESGVSIGIDAAEIIAGMEQELAKRLGGKQLDALRGCLAEHWGDLPEIPPAK